MRLVGTDAGYVCPEYGGAPIDDPYYLFEHEGTFYEYDVLREGGYSFFICPEGSTEESILAYMAPTAEKISDPDPDLLLQIKAIIRLLP